ncbi:MAG TPA: hypothetical protein VK636_14470 [Gemmatimonadaceae bacterium]|nr:hypothetical protein [Gemmatimonadaceae bacterium]
MFRSLVVTPTLTILAILAVACHQVAPPDSRSETRFFGRLSYKAIVDSREERGIFIIDPDTAVIEAEGAFCREGAVGKVHHFYSWSCSMGGGDYSSLTITLDADKAPPLSTWRATHTVKRQRQVCVAYTTNAKGEQVCTKNGTETYDASETKTGRVLTLPVGGAGD